MCLKVVFVGRIIVRWKLGHDGARSARNWVLQKCNCWYCWKWDLLTKTHSICCTHHAKEEDEEEYYWSNKPIDNTPHASAIAVVATSHVSIGLPFFSLYCKDATNLEKALDTKKQKTLLKNKCFKINNNNWLSSFVTKQKTKSNQNTSNQSPETIFNSTNFKITTTLAYSCSFKHVGIDWSRTLPIYVLHIETVHLFSC